MAKQLTNAGSDGTVYGQSATEKLGFFGTTAVVRPTVSATVTSSAVHAANFALLVSALGQGSGGLGLITAAA